MKTMSLKRGVLLLVSFAALLMAPTAALAQSKLLKSASKMTTSTAKSATKRLGIKTPVPTPSIATKIDTKSTTASTQNLLNSRQLGIIALPQIDSTTFNNRPAINSLPASQIAPCVLDTRLFDTLIDAQQHMSNKEYDKAKELVSPLAEEGDMNAQYLMGAIYILSDGEDRDINIAMSWFKRAAEQGHEAAQMMVAEIEKSNIKATVSY
jgi:hypothetical protein